MSKYDHVTPEKFVEIWESSASAEEAAKRLGMPRAICHARASKYRTLGIHLKMMPKPTPKNRLDVEAMNRLVEKINKKRGKVEG